MACKGHRAWTLFYMPIDSWPSIKLMICCFDIVFSSQIIYIIIHYLFSFVTWYQQHQKRLNQRLTCLDDLSHQFWYDSLSWVLLRYLWGHTKPNLASISPKGLNSRVKPSAFLGPKVVWFYWASTSIIGNWFHMKPEKGQLLWCDPILLSLSIESNISPTTIGE